MRGLRPNRQAHRYQRARATARSCQPNTKTTASSAPRIRTKRDERRTIPKGQHVGEETEQGACRSVRQNTGVRENLVSPWHQPNEMHGQVQTKKRTVNAVLAPCPAIVQRHATAR